MNVAISLYKYGQRFVEEGASAVCDAIERTEVDHSRIGRLAFVGDLGANNKPTQLRYLPTDKWVDKHEVIVYEGIVIDPVGNYLCDFDTYASLLCRWNNGIVMIDRKHSYLGSFLAAKFKQEGFAEFIRIRGD